MKDFLSKAVNLYTHLEQLETVFSPSFTTKKVGRRGGINKVTEGTNMSKLWCPNMRSITHFYHLLELDRFRDFIAVEI